MKLLRVCRRGENRGFSLLEYVIGAALLAGIVWTAMQAMGSSMEAFFNGLGSWLGRRTADLRS